MVLLIQIMRHIIDQVGVFLPYLLKPTFQQDLEIVSRHFEQTSYSSFRRRPQKIILYCRTTSYARERIGVRFSILAYELFSSNVQYVSGVYTQS